MRPTWILIALSSLAACAGAGPALCDTRAEEAAVYAAVIDSFYARRWGAPSASALPGEAVVRVLPIAYGPEHWGAAPATGISGPPTPDGLWMRLVGITPGQRFGMPAEYWRLPGSLFAGYRAANVQPAPLAPIRTSALRVTVFDSAAMARHFPSTHGPYDSTRFDPDGDWARFVAAHPRAHGLLLLSRAGFDDGCEWAVVAVGHDLAREDLTRRGGYVFLRRGPVGWRVWRTAGNFN